ncbi:MAG TPA: hypothetical protein VFC10_05225 [Terriglobia bacterium]|jgi:hypothetical protein|nr:hypothetical protein [Terriglobia bacterium]
MRRFAVASVVCVLAFVVALQAKDKAGSNPIVGTWNCIAHGGENGDVSFTLYLQESAGGLTGTVSAPQGDADLSSVTFKDNKLKIDIDAGDSNYSLTATYAAGKLTGEWSRDGQKQGTWEGKK